jgi:hypothetical protein
VPSRSTALCQHTSCVRERSRALCQHTSCVSERSRALCQHTSCVSERSRALCQHTSCVSERSRALCQHTSCVPSRSTALPGTLRVSRACPGKRSQPDSSAGHHASTRNSCNGASRRPIPAGSEVIPRQRMFGQCFSLHFRHFTLDYLPGAWYNKAVIPQTMV